MTKRAVPGLRPTLRSSLPVGPVAHAASIIAATSTVARPRILPLPSLCTPTDIRYQLSLWGNRCRRLMIGRRRDYCCGGVTRQRVDEDRTKAFPSCLGCSRSLEEKPRLAYSAPDRAA